jgi:hypothetical protein
MKLNYLQEVLETYIFNCLNVRRHGAKQIVQYTYIYLHYVSTKRRLGNYQELLSHNVQDENVHIDMIFEQHHNRWHTEIHFVPELTTKWSRSSSATHLFPLRWSKVHVDSVR